MRRKIITGAVLLAMVAMIGGCSEKTLSNDTIKISQYKGLEIQKVELSSVSDDDVEAKINQNLEDAATYTEVDREAKDGDTVNVDYVGKVDGKEFDGGTSDGAEIEIGSGTYIGENGEYKGFEEQLIGHKAGDKFKITVKFPSDYSEELGDKIAEFSITLNSVKEKTVPEFNDEWVAANSSSSKTTDEYKAEIKEELTKSNAEQQEYSLQSEALTALLENVEFVTEPTEEIEEKYNTMYANYESYAQSSGLEMEEFVSQYMNTTLDELKADLEKEAKDSVKEEEAVELIASSENITLSDEEYEAELKDLADEYGYDDTAAFEKEYTKETIEDYLLEGKVLNWLVDKAKQVDSTEEEVETVPEATTAAAEADTASK